MKESDKIDKQGYILEDLLIEQTEAKRTVPAKRPTPRVNLAERQDHIDILRTSEKPLVLYGALLLDLADLTKYADALEEEAKRRDEAHSTELQKAQADAERWKRLHDDLASADAFLMLVCVAAGLLVGAAIAVWLMRG